MRLALAVLAVSALAPGIASANLVMVFSSTSGTLSGTLPATTGTYVTANFQSHLDNAAIPVGTVQLTWSVPTTEAGLFVGSAGINFSDQYTITGTNTLAMNSPVTYNVNGIPVMGTGNEPFNTHFDFPQSPPRLTNGNPAIYSITGFSVPVNGDLSGLFTLNSAPPINGGGYYAAVHIQGYGGGGGGSAGIAPTIIQVLPGPPAGVPEPSTLALAAVVGLVGFVAARRRRKKS